MKKIEIALLGLGTVGTGVAKVLINNQEKIEQVTGYKITVSKALVISKAEREDDFTRSSNIELVENLDEILKDDNIQIVCELMGGTGFAKTAIEESMKAGKHIVTANKDLIAVAGRELEALADENKVSLYYEAAVAGGIPILRPLVTTLATDKITKIVGIVNGTTNYILTKMQSEGLDYEEALKEAQDKGFAEADPSGDVDGLDAARKMVILTRLGLGMDVDLDDVKVHGIRNIDIRDLEQAGELGYTVKLLGVSELINGKVHVEVSPMLVKNDHPLAGINNEMNAVYTIGEATGEMMFYGAGAGELPTGNSVASDILQVVKDIEYGATGQPVTRFHQETVKAAQSDILTKGYFSLILNDEPGSFSHLADLFGNLNISFDKIYQDHLDNDKRQARVTIVTHTVTAEQKNEVITQLKAHDEIEFVYYFDVMR